MPDADIYKFVVSGTFTDGSSYSGTFTIDYDQIKNPYAGENVYAVDVKDDRADYNTGSLYQQSNGEYTVDLFVSGAGTENPNFDLDWYGAQPSTITGSEVNVVSGGSGPPQFEDPRSTSTGDATVTQVSCFCRRTMILTPLGEVPVEALRIGDLVTTLGGEAKPIRWIGTSTVFTRFTDPLRVLPIRIAAGALAETVPSRDLFLSPDHAVLIDHALIQAGALVNGSTVTRQTNVPERFAYYHVELAEHAILIADGTPAESFVDNTDRLGFDNWAEHQELYGEEGWIPELPYPRAKSHRQVPVAVRARLVDRAAKISTIHTAA